MEIPTYYLSADNCRDEKCVWLWRETERGIDKIACFRSDRAALIFAKDYCFPLSSELKERLKDAEENK